MSRDGQEVNEGSRGQAAQLRDGSDAITGVDGLNVLSASKSDRRRFDRRTVPGTPILKPAQTQAGMLPRCGHKVLPAAEALNASQHACGGGCERLALEFPSQALTPFNQQLAQLWTGCLVDERSRPVNVDAFTCRRGQAWPMQDSRAKEWVFKPTCVIQRLPQRDGSVRVLGKLVGLIGTWMIGNR